MVPLIKKSMLDNLFSMKKLAAAYTSAIFTSRNTVSHRLFEREQKCHTYLSHCCIIEISLIIS